MRFLEAVLSSADLIAFFSMILSLPPNLRWVRYSVPVALLIALGQIALEGPRWQMIPAYIWTVALVAIWLVCLVLPNGLYVHGLVAGINLGLAGLWILVSLFLPILLPVFHFPKPTGPYTIGTLTYHWVDADRPELFTDHPDDPRELMVQVWYPAREEPSAPCAPYISDADSITPDLARIAHLPRFFFAHLKYVTTNAVSSAPIAEDQPSYPVLVYLTGLDGFRQASTFQIEELVSHGHIVVGLDQPGAVASVRFPDGRQIHGSVRDQLHPLIQQSLEPQQPAPMSYGTALPDGIIPYLAQDVQFALDQLAVLNASEPDHILTGRLDLEHIGVFGISMGGMNAAEACLKDPRLKACLIMDAAMPADVVKAGLQQPTMFITRDAETMRLERQRSGGWSEADISLTLTTIRAIYETLPGDGYYIQVPAMFHINFTDVPYWSPIFSQIGLTGPIDRQRAFDIVNAYTLAFFDQHLRGHVSPLLDGSTQLYPEVNLETRTR